MHWHCFHTIDVIFNSEFIVGRWYVRISMTCYNKGNPMHIQLHYNIFILQSSHCFGLVMKGIHHNAVQASVKCSHIQ